MAGLFSALSAVVAFPIITNNEGRTAPGQKLAKLISANLASNIERDIALPLWEAGAKAAAALRRDARISFCMVISILV